MNREHQRLPFKKGILQVVVMEKEEEKQRNKKMQQQEEEDAYSDIDVNDDVLANIYMDDDDNTLYEFDEEDMEKKEEGQEEEEDTEEKKEEKEDFALRIGTGLQKIHGSEYTCVCFSAESVIDSALAASLEAKPYPIMGKYVESEDIEQLRNIGKEMHKTSSYRARVTLYVLSAIPWANVIQLLDVGSYFDVVYVLDWGRVNLQSSPCSPSGFPLVVDSKSKTVEPLYAVGAKLGSESTGYRKRVFCGPWRNLARFLPCKTYASKTWANLLSYYEDWKTTSESIAFRTTNEVFDNSLLGEAKKLFCELEYRIKGEEERGAALVKHSLPYWISRRILSKANEEDPISSFLYHLVHFEGEKNKKRPETNWDKKPSPLTNGSKPTQRKLSTSVQKRVDSSIENHTITSQKRKSPSNEQEIEPSKKIKTDRLSEEKASSYYREELKKERKRNAELEKINKSLKKAIFALKSIQDVNDHEEQQKDGMIPFSKKQHSYPYSRPPPYTSHHPYAFAHYSTTTTTDHPHPHHHQQPYPYYPRGRRGTRYTPRK